MPGDRTANPPRQVGKAVPGRMRNMQVASTDNRPGSFAARAGARLAAKNPLPPAAAMTVTRDGRYGPVAGPQGGVGRWRVRSREVARRGKKARGTATPGGMGACPARPEKAATRPVFTAPARTAYGYGDDGRNGSCYCGRCPLDTTGSETSGNLTLPALMTVNTGSARPGFVRAPGRVQVRPAAPARRTPAGQARCRHWRSGPPDPARPVNVPPVPQGTSPGAAAGRTSAGGRAWRAGD